MEKFDFSNLTLYYRNPNKPTGEPEDERVVELAVQMHEEPICFSMGTFSADVLSQAKEYAERAGFENVTVEKSRSYGDFGVEIMENGNNVARYRIDSCVAEEDWEKILPNGEKAFVLDQYGWDEYERLEALVAEQDTEFGQDVGKIQGQEDNMEQ